MMRGILRFGASDSHTSTEHVFVSQYLYRVFVLFIIVFVSVYLHFVSVYLYSCICERWLLRDCSSDSQQEPLRSKLLLIEKS